MHVPNTSLTLSTVSAATLPRRRTARPTHWPIVAATSFGFALMQLDVSIVNVELARIGESLGGEVAGLQWVINSYAIAFASLLLAAGALGDRLARDVPTLPASRCLQVHRWPVASHPVPGRS